MKDIIMRCASCGEDKEFDEEGLFADDAPKTGWVCRDCGNRKKGEVEW